MQPASPKAGKPDAPSEGSPKPLQSAEAIPPQIDSDEDSWESLGSTRITENPISAKPQPSELASTVISGTDPTLKRMVQSEPATREPATLRDFELIEKVGEGAMGAVYKARQISFQRDVALKILFPHIANNPKLVARLNREGETMFRLDHPNIVQAFGIYEDRGWHFIALEFVEGQTMQKWLDQIGRISLGDTLHIVLTCARALEYAHKLGVVHRDIKPDNILINQKGEIKVADLGMVKVDDEDMALTQTGHAVGTPWYMPLEQAKNAKETDGRSDIYALGCMLYCFLTGTPPFAGRTLLDVIRDKEVGTFPPARQLNQDVPERLDLIITKMTAKLPKYRYQNCTELIQDLESLDLANKRLEFLTPKPPPAAPSADKPPSSHDEVRAVAAADPNVWYVRIKDHGGQKTIQKLTTDEVQKLLADNVLAPNNKASHDEKQGFRALATYKEFQGIALVKASKQSADDRAVRYRTLYKKIEQQANEREKELEHKRPDTPPWQPLAIQFAAGFVALVLVILFFWWLSR